MILVVGISHKTAPLEVREKFSANADVLPAVLSRLAARPELSEVMFVSTCNRVEVVARSRTPGEEAGLLAVNAAREVLREHAGDARDFDAYLYDRTGEEAVRHVFRVAASLDSMVLGEPQILGQVKEAYEAAMGAGTLRGPLGRCVHRAFTVAKRVRTETQIGAGTVSISSVAVDLARRIFGGLDQSTVLLVGAGEMAEAAAKALGKGAKSMRVVNRSVERAAELAAHFGASAAPLDALEEELVHADVVVTSTGSPHFIVTKDLVKRVMRARRGRTLFFIDIAVPRNVDPRIDEVDNVFLFNVDDLEKEVAEGQKARHGELARAESIVDEELKGFLAWVRGLKVQPLVVGLRAKTRGVLVAELERTLAGRLKHLPDADRSALLQMMESATNKLLHTPLSRLKEAAASDDDEQLAQALATAFDIVPREEEVDSAPSGASEVAETSAPGVEAERVTH